MKNKFVLTASLLFSLITKHSSASHASGGEIVYRCLGSDQYEVTLTFYRDCDGILAPSVMSLNFSNSCGISNPPTINLSPTSSSPTMIDYLCPTALSTCIGGTHIGIEKWVYTGIITLPAPCNSWVISHSENARNSAITTITGAGLEDLFLYATINNSGGLCNNSPFFINEPVFIICSGQISHLSQGAFDMDGDSISFQLTQPRIGPSPGDTVTYLSGYSYIQPLLSNPPVTFNTHTGSLGLSPIQPDVSPVAILVNEFRNGVLIGQVVRDIQLIVNTCNNSMPALSGINGQPGFNAQICAGDSICFFIASYDSDFSNTTTIKWDHSLANATFTTTFGTRDTAYLCWRPVPADTLNSPYCISLSVTDDNCPYFGYNYYDYCIEVVPPLPSCSSVSIGTPKKVSWDISATPQPARDKILFDFGDNFTSKADTELKLYSAWGKLMQRSLIHGQKLTLELGTNFPPGFYFAIVQDKSGHLLGHKKIVVIR